MKAVIGWNFNILNILCLIIFPSSTLNETDYRLSAKHKEMYIVDLTRVTISYEIY